MTYRRIPRSERPLRSINCRRCNHDTGYPGAAFCDACLPEIDPASILLTDADRRRLPANEPQENQCRTTTST